MNIFTERLILRTFKLKDANQFLEMIQDDDVKHYLKGIYEKSKSKVRENIAIYKAADFVNDYYYAIEERQSGMLVGAIIATRMNKHEIEVAYFVDKKYRRQGYMKEALSIFLNRACCNNNGKSFKFVIDKGNIPSIKLMKTLNIPVYAKADSQYIFKFYGGQHYDY